jgi:hypothetical protein
VGVSSAAAAGEGKGQGESGGYKEGGEAKEYDVLLGADARRIVRPFLPPFLSHQPISASFPLPFVVFPARNGFLC